ncbi:MAG: hypothetical protein WBY53_11390 [Acidobacteriaceae bacterium]
MIKRILLGVFEFVAYLLLLGIGGYWDVVRLLIGGYAPKLSGLLNLLPLIKFQVSSTHLLIADGIIFAGVFCLILLIIEVIRRASRSTMATTVILYLVAVALSLAVKVGLPPSS